MTEREAGKSAFHTVGETAHPVAAGEVIKPEVVLKSWGQGSKSCQRTSPPLASRARNAEARLRYAQQLDQLAATIAHLERQGAPKPEIEKMRALYMDLYLARP